MDVKKLFSRLRSGPHQNKEVLHEKLKSGGFEFVGPKEGRIEDELKADWSTAFRAKPSVARAYLAVTSHFITDGAPMVALCIRFKDDTVHEDVVFEAASLFRRKNFHLSQMLDIVPISGSQEETLAAVCVPFYDSVSNHDPGCNGAGPTG